MDRHALKTLHKLGWAPGEQFEENGKRSKADIL